MRNACKDIPVCSKGRAWRKGGRLYVLHHYDTLCHDLYVSINFLKSHILCHLLILVPCEII